MSSDDYSDNTLHFNSGLQHGFTNSIHATSYDKIEMNIGHWYLDEFGNRTREITTSDALRKSKCKRCSIQIAGPNKYEPRRRA